MMSTRLIPPRARRAMTAVGLLLTATLALAAGQPAQAQTSAACNVAPIQGSDGPADYGAYCWIDFSGYDSYQATHGGQDFLVDLPGAATLSFTLSVSGNNSGEQLAPHAVPSWNGAAFGYTAFNSILGAPVLYQTTQTNPTSVIEVSNLALNANGSTDLPFRFVAADGESSNEGESITFHTTGTFWDMVAAPGQGTRVMPALSGVGTQTVTEDGTAGTVGSYVFATNNSPGTVTATLHGSGLQGVLFGMKFHSVDLAVTKSYSGDRYAGGQGSYLIEVSNTITANQHPPTALQPIRVLDTLPDGVTYTGFSGSGWSCSAAGQLVTCDLAGANLDTTPGVSVPLADLHINVSIDAGAPATMTNTATVKDNTSGYVFDTDAGNNTSDPVVLTLSSPDLSTSTKTFDDLNGGDAEPGDVIEYTITLHETGGVPVTGASVNDPLPAHIEPNSLEVISVPANSTDGSAGFGGTNGTGLVLVSNIALAANGSAQIVYRVTIDSTAQAGDTIHNVATISHPGYPDTKPAADVTVGQSQVPVSGNKVLYVYDNGDLTRTPQSGAGSAVSIAYNSSHTWTLTPALAKPLTLVGGNQVSVNLLVRRGNCDDIWGNCPAPTWTATLYDNTISPGTRIGSTSPDTSFGSTGYTAETANITVPTNTTVAAGHRLILVITNTSARPRFWQGSYTPQVEQYVGGQLSTVTVSVSTVINVDSIGTFDDADCSNPYPADKVYETAGTVYLCAVVSDPFGADDVAPSGGTVPQITITDSASTEQVVSATMTHVTAADTAASKTFSYAYTLPTSTSGTLELGSWTAAVTAWEGTEHTINDVGTGTFVVGAPDLLIVKSVAVVDNPVEGSIKPKAIPGATLRYAINITNQGKGEVGTDTLKVTDAIPEHTSFVIDSVTGSGTGSGLDALTSSDIKYSNDHGNSWTYAPSGSAGSTDPAVTNIQFTPTGTMPGKTDTNTPTYTIEFKVKLQ